MSSTRAQSSTRTMHFEGIFIVGLLVNTFSCENIVVEVSENNHLETEDSGAPEDLLTTVPDDLKLYFDDGGGSTTTLPSDIDTTIDYEDGTTVPSPPGREYQRPNVILIIADDLGFNDVSFHGSPQIPTPNIDALAISGVILNSYYVSPICTPSRSAMFSGRHPIHTGMQHDVIYGTTPYGFPLQYKLLPEYLKELGYSTALVGKWHLGHFQRKYTPACRGFDRHLGHWTGHKDYYDNTAQETGPQAWGYDMRRDFETTYENFGRYSTDVYTEEASSIIQNHNDSRPLFLTMSHTAVHSANPYQLLQAPKENVENFERTISNVQRRIYAAMVQKLDESVGSIVKALFEKQMLDNSIIIFTTDNGGPAAGFNGNAASNWPLRGVKNTLWEGGVRGAGLIWSPFIDQAAVGVSNQLIHIQDWLPTILSAAGVYDPAVMTGSIDGIDMWDTIRHGLKSPRTELLHNIDDLYGNEAVRVGPWKLLHGTTYQGKWDGWYGPSGRKGIKKPPRSRPTSSTPSVEKLYRLASQSEAGKAVRSLQMFPTNPAKISDILQRSQVVCNKTVVSMRRRQSSCSLKSGEYCLYNIEEDPCEFNNLAHDRPDMVEQLKEKLKSYRDSAAPLLNQPKDSRGLPIFWNYTWSNWMDLLGNSETVNLCI